MYKKLIFVTTITVIIKTAMYFLIHYRSFYTNKNKIHVEFILNLLPEVENKMYYSRFRTNHSNDLHQNARWRETSVHHCYTATLFSV